MGLDIKTIGKGVVITAISLVVLHYIKPSLPASLRALLD